MAARHPTLELEHGLESELTTAWCSRFGPEYATATLPGVVVRALVEALSTGDTADLIDGAQALGVLRAQEGRQASAVVEDLLALRSTLWGRLSLGSRSDRKYPAGDGFEDDPGALIMLHQRSTELVDVALRAAVQAFVSESQRVLSIRATRDPLTGVLNRAAIDEAIARELASRANPPALLLLDLDGFKQVNDRLGHLAGDSVLRSVAAMMVEVCRAGDVVGRVGGDEFVILLPETSSHEADLVARRLLSVVLRSDALVGDGAAPIGVSIGLAALPRPISAAALLNAADEAMYTAKRSGGSAVAHAPPRPVER